MELNNENNIFNSPHFNNNNKNNKNNNNKNKNEIIDEKIYLSLYLKNNILGITIYDETENILYIDQIQAFVTDLETIIHHIKLIKPPSLILLGTKIVTDPQLLQLIIKSIYEDEKDYPYKILKTSSWDYNKARDIIINNLKIKELKFNELNNKNAPFLSFHSLSSFINFDEKMLISSLGAMILYLQTNFFNLEENPDIKVITIKHININEYMQIDAISFKSLQIFNEEYHPNIIRGKGKSKEGYSLFGLFDRTLSLNGRNTLRQWFLKPLQNIEKIKKRQNGIEALLLSENSELIKQLTFLLKKFHLVPKILLRIKKVMAKPKDWYYLSQSIEVAIKIYSILQIFEKRQSNIIYQEFIQDILYQIDTNILQTCLFKLNAVIDFDETLNEERIIVNDGFNEELDNLKRTFSELEDLLAEVGKQVLSENPLLSQLSVEYVPQVGYLIAIIKTDCDFVDNKFEFLFEQNNTLFYKNSHTKELDDKIGDIQSGIIDLEASIIRSLEDEILECEACLQMTSMSLGNLDSLLSLSFIAKDFSLIKPQIEFDNVIIIKSGRHPLQELTVETFIPNDTFITNNKSMMIVTGSNFSGKSVYLKQIGIITYLTHIGSYVPAEKAIIGLTDRIFTRISSIESSTVAQSTFTIDCNQISYMLRSSTSNSLLLIDEYGKGTCELDGISLLSSLIYKLGEIKCKTILTTHFLDIFHENIIQEKESSHFKLYQMDLYLPSINNNNNNNNDIIDENPIPLFRLIPGVVSSSYGISCAKIAGLDDDLIKRSNEILEMIKLRIPFRPIKNSKSYQDFYSDNIKKLILYFLNCNEFNDDNINEFRLLLKNI